MSSESTGWDRMRAACYLLPVSRPFRPAFLVPAAGGLLFSVLATLNAGGYRYGASDQAFYIPAIRRHLDPALFPRDWSLLAPQDALNVFTAGAAWICRATGLPLPQLFFLLYLVGLLVLAAAAAAFGKALYRSAWTTVALLAALTLRHAVALGAVNTLEGYMHPRMVAFAIGSLAVALYLQRRTWVAASLVSAALIVHPTTGIWFAAWLGVALLVSEPRLRWPLGSAAAVLAAGTAWAVTVGPLAPRMVRMDPLWLSALASKTYLFASSWPAWAWITSAIYPVAIAGVYIRRRRDGMASVEETGVVWGAGALLLFLFASLPLVSARLALAVQLQVPRVLWMLDLLAVVYLLWWLAEAGGTVWRRRVVTAVLVAASVGRGIYVMRVEHPERAVVRLGFADTAWHDAMRWVEANTPPSAFILADPGHAWRYGTSVRVAAARDVFLEEAKDTAFALYSRAGATRVLDRIARVPTSPWDAGAVKVLSRDFGLDVLVSEQEFPLPVLHVSPPFRVYQLR